MNAAKAKRRAPKGPRFLPRLRVNHGSDVALGPGKVELLERIAEKGSIALAAAHMGMSYRRARTLVRTMNGCFREPVVQAVRGGRTRGAAQVTETGRVALELYRKMETQAITSTAGSWNRLLALLKK